MSTSIWKQVLESFIATWVWLIAWMFGTPLITQGISKPVVTVDGPLTVEELDAVQYSWALVKKDLKTHSLNLFLHFLSLYPQYQSKFPAFSNIQKTELSSNRAVKAHAFTVATALSGFVEHLEDTEVLGELLFKTGVNHRGRGLGIEDFQNLNIAILDYFSIALGKCCTPVVVSGWTKTLNVILEKVGEGLNSSIE